MPSFTTRVELHNATWQDYNTLHDAMATEGFARVIAADDGSVYELPTAEYDLNGNFTAAQALAKAQRAASKTYKTHGILVTQAQMRTWSGLKQIRAAQRA